MVSYVFECGTEEPGAMAGCGIRGLDARYIRSVQGEQALLHAEAIDQPIRIVH